MKAGSPLRLADIDTLDFAKADGLLPAVVQHADTGAVLDTRTLSDFANGVYAVWNLKGNVVIHLTNTSPGANAVLSGLFFG